MEAEETNKYILISMLILFLGNLVVWFQLNAQFKWEWFKEHWIMLSLFGAPISAVFYWATRFSYIGFNELLWPGRLIAFGISMITFPIFTWLLLNEGMTIKTIVSMILALIIIIIQLW